MCKGLLEAKKVLRDARAGLIALENWVESLGLPKEEDSQTSMDDFSMPSLPSGNRTDTSDMGSSSADPYPIYPTRSSRKAGKRARMAILDTSPSKPKGPTMSVGVSMDVEGFHVHVAGATSADWQRISCFSVELVRRARQQALFQQ